LIYSEDEEVLADSCWALSFLSDGANDRIQLVIDAGVCRRLVELLRHTSSTIQTPALRTVGNIVTGNDDQTQLILHCGALNMLLPLLSSPRKPLRKESCWTISNITAGNRAQIQAVIDSNIIPPLVHLLNNDEFDIQKEAAWAISNATCGGGAEHIRYLVEQGCVSPLVNLLDRMDAKIVIVALEGLQNILKWGESSKDKEGNNPYSSVIELAGGVEKLEQLQRHENQKVYDSALSILEKYFEGEEEGEEAMMVPDVQEDGSMFAFNSGNVNGGFQAPSGGYHFPES